jgi:cytochrome c biogenesis protein CcmG, thiol:disulfide interchange protein DsbE
MTATGLRRALTSAFAFASALAACSSPPNDEDAYRPLAVGDTVPPYAATTLRGDSVRVGSTGALTLVNVWATWCTSCREEMADLEAIHRDYAPRGLRVVAVSVDKGDGEKVRRFAEAERLTFAIAHDPAGRVQQLYQVAAVPETYLVSADGRLLWQRKGGLHGAAAEARTAINRAIGS